MSKLTQSEIRNMARTIIAGRSSGIRYSELVKEISRQSPATPVNTIHGGHVGSGNAVPQRDHQTKSRIVSAVVDPGRADGRGDDHGP